MVLVIALAGRFAAAHHLPLPVRAPCPPPALFVAPSSRAWPWVVVVGLDLRPVLVLGRSRSPCREHPPPGAGPARCPAPRDRARRPPGSTPRGCAPLSCSSSRPGISSPQWRPHRQSEHHGHRRDHLAGLTVLFGTLAGGRGRGMARRRPRRAHCSRRPGASPSPDRQHQAVASTALKAGDVVVVRAGERIPGDGDVVEASHLVDRSAVTGEVRSGHPESGGDRSAVTGGTVVLSDQIVVRITSGQTLLRRPDDRAGRRFGAPAHPNESRSTSCSRS